MDWRSERKAIIFMVIGFLTLFFLPVGMERFDRSILEALYLTKWYAQEHVLLCLIPAFFIAGAISIFLSQGSVMRYLGAKSNKIISYLVASISGTILAVCSCTILPLFAGIYKRGAGIGPASAFLYSGPAINILAIILTANVLGSDIGIARAIGAIVFSIVIGILMATIFKNDETEKNRKNIVILDEESERSIWKTVLYFAFMILILVFANWGKPQDNDGVWFFIYSNKWVITSIFAICFSSILIFWYSYSVIKMGITAILVILSIILGFGTPLIPFSIGFLGISWAALTGTDESKDWINSTWGYTKQIIPLLLIGVVIAGFLLGRVGYEGMIPSEWIRSLVGGNSFLSNFFASIVGAFMYFATLTEIPILQGLMNNGMGDGPALALLLAGPALSLPNMLVIRSLIGTKKTAVFVILVIVMATISGIIFGLIS